MAKRLLALLLAVMMAIGTPVTVWANSAEATEVHFHTEECLDEHLHEEELGEDPAEEIPEQSGVDSAEETPVQPGDDSALLEEPSMGEQSSDIIEEEIPEEEIPEDVEEELPEEEIVEEEPQEGELPLIEDVQLRIDAILAMYGIDDSSSESDISLAISEADLDTYLATEEQMAEIEALAAGLSEEDIAGLVGVEAYAAGAYYEVVEGSYDAAAGSFAVKVKDGVQPVAGKVQLAAVIGDDEAQIVKLALTVKLHTKAPTFKLGKTSVTLNAKLGSDSFTTPVVVTPSDYKVIAGEEGNFSWSVTDSKGNPYAEAPLNVAYQNGKVTVSTNDKTTPGASYKVNFMLDGAAKPVSMTVKTLAEAKSIVKLTLSAKGKLVTGDLKQGVTITPKWTNFSGVADIGANIRVLATLKNAGITNRDVTENFVITKNADGTYTLKVKDLDAMSNLPSKATYSVVVKDALVGNSVASTTKATKITMTLTKAKVTQSTKTVELHMKDRYDEQDFILSLQDKSLPAIKTVKVVDSKIAKFYELEDLGNGRYSLGYNHKGDLMGVKAGSVKLAVYLEGNNPAYGTPNATVTVSVKLVKAGK